MHCAAVRLLCSYQCCGTHGWHQPDPSCLPSQQPRAAAGRQQQARQQQLQPAASRVCAVPPASPQPHQASPSWASPAAAAWSCAGRRAARGAEIGKTLAHWASGMPPSPPAAASMKLLVLELLLAAEAAAALELGLEQGPRVAIERSTVLRLRTSGDEPPLSAAAALRCVVNRNDGEHGGGFKLTMPPWTRGLDNGQGPLGFMHGLVVPGRRQSASLLECDLPPVITSGNTTVALLAPGGSTTNSTIDPRWRPVFVEHFALFQPEFGRRPYVRETEGEIVAALDKSLFGLAPLTISATIGGKPTRHTLTSVHGPWLRLPFGFGGLPRTLYELVNITLALPSGEVIRHPRTFARAPPPEALAPANLSRAAVFPVVWQVDAVTRALRADSTPVIANGWFSGGYDHESAGTPPRAEHPFAGSGQNMSSWLHTQQSMSQASRMIEWGKRGITFQRTGIGYCPLGACPKAYRLSNWHPDQNLTDMIRVLDSAAAVGVPVLLNIGVDSLASKTYNKSSGSIDPSMRPAGTDLTDCRGEPYCEWIREGVLAFRDHPGLSGYYA
eukprot:COSAG01_NODE_246_length_20450_cov_195.166822_4_plen_556_part_00